MSTKINNLYITPQKYYLIQKKLQKKRLLILKSLWYLGRESNPHGRNVHRILSPACLPIPPPRQLVIKKSERRDSNPRPRPWQGRALPTELLSQYGCKYIKLFTFSTLQNKK